MLADRFGIGWGNRFERQARKFLPVVEAAGGSIAQGLDHLLSTRIFRSGKVIGRYDTNAETLEVVQQALMDVFGTVTDGALPRPMPDGYRKRPQTPGARRVKVFDRYLDEIVTLPEEVEPGRYRLLNRVTLNEQSVLEENDLLLSDGRERCLLDGEPHGFRDGARRGDDDPVASLILRSVQTLASAVPCAAGRATVAADPERAS
ncbi:hypothetical protein ACU4HD_19630 [Cupriavidus basilensis]